MLLDLLTRLFIFLPCLVDVVVLSVKNEAFACDGNIVDVMSRFNALFLTHHGLYVIALVFDATISSMLT